MGYSGTALGWAAAGLVTLTAACGNTPFGKGIGEGGAAPAAAPERLVERDVESPEVFQTAEDGLWDGRPSLGGVWVAHPAARDPERVIIRNLESGAFVVGALFRRQREGAGPALQVSSDAAEALGMTAGRPARLEVTALRRVSVSETPASEEAALETPAGAGATEPAAPAADTPAPDAGPAPEISVTPLAAAAAAIERADGAAESAQARGPADIVSSPVPRARPEARAPNGPPSRAAQNLSTLDRPFIQVGFFGRRENAEATDARLRANGILPMLRGQTRRGKTYWRVIVGPLSNSHERADLLARLRGMGFADAYFVAE